MAPKRQTLRVLLAVTIGALVASPPPSRAVDGVVEINQIVALAGGVTPSDEPGFPVTIDHAGSYRLTGDIRLTGLPNPAEITAIEVIADGVAIDLNGFRIGGTTSCTGDPLSCSPIGPGRGIDASSVAGVSVTNGSVRGMGGDGIALGRGGVVEGVRAWHNGEDGVQIGGGGRVVGNVFRRNGAAGLFVFGPGTLVAGNAAADNGGDGIHVRNGAAVRGNTVTASGGDGIDVEGNGGTVVDNVVWNSGGSGIVASDTATGLARNVTGDNAGDALSGGSAFGSNLCDSALCP